MMQMIGATQNFEGSVEKLQISYRGQNMVFSYASILCWTAYGQPARSRYTPHLGSIFPTPSSNKSCKLTKTTLGWGEIFVSTKSHLVNTI
jgi:hypothetical protein